MSRRAEAPAASPVLVTMGEPAGIGPEVAAAAFRALKGVVGRRAIKLVGDAQCFRAFGELTDETFWPADPRLHAPTSESAIAAVDVAVRAALARKAGAIVTAPINKAMLLEKGFRFAGHTDYLAEATGAPRAVMMLVGAGLRVVPLTIHVALREIPALLSGELIVETATIVLEALARDFSLSSPRLAISGLNPHAGESGHLGREEIDIIQPAVGVLRARGHRVCGPLPADTMFHAAARAEYDAALCMYHDQALIPLKTLAFWEGVNVTLGLPIVRTSPDHGTAFDIAGRGVADPRSMIAAIRLAADMADARGF